MTICIITDPLLNDFGPARPALLLSKELAKKYDVSLVSTSISKDIYQKLNSFGVKPVNLGVRFHFKDSSLVWIEAWSREAFLSLNSHKFKRNDEILLNFSNTIIIPSNVWFVLGPTTSALDNIRGELPWYFQYMYRILRPAFFYADRKNVRLAARKSNIVIATSNYCASLYRRFNVKVHDVIYVPIDCEKFKPLRDNSSNKYVITYFGKETKFSTIQKVADKGIKVKAFGAKLSYVPKGLLNHPNVEILGHISDEELVRLYSNALFTIFPFTNEEFGYIPVESMACGTPVLTYAFQGPGETVINGETGWLAKSENEIVRLATYLWQKAYSSEMREKCRQRALDFDVKKISQQWLNIIKTIREPQ
ncbi:MAG: glycosyltransferase family 4 protein [Candidatus Jordarchaeum sp.]|uniref:glycosyltransferase family 4 protein n=1 Tax=Candidatus Jordarchaeum sp. TaxID=2823881 RepID=UPI004049A33B